MHKHKLFNDNYIVLFKTDITIFIQIWLFRIL